MTSAALVRRGGADGHVRQESRAPSPPTGERTAGARMEPSRHGAANACRVVPRLLSHVSVGPAAPVLAGS